MRDTHIVKNSPNVTKWLKELKKNADKYSLMSKEQERRIIDEYVELVYDENGQTILNKNSKLYKKYMETDDENKKLELFYSIPRVWRWKKDEKTLKHILITHNIRFVFNIAKKYNKLTFDYDNMIAKGMFGLANAANEFNFFEPILVIDENDPNKQRKIPKINEKTGQIEYCKFNTYARSWIFKYVVQEFSDKTVQFIDNFSFSIDNPTDFNNTINENQTQENYIDEQIDVNYVKPKTIDDELSSDDITEFYKNIYSYLEHTNELTSMEKKIITESYYNHLKVKDIAEKMNLTPQNVMVKKTSGLKKLQKYLKRTYNISSFSDFSV